MKSAKKRLKSTRQSFQNKLVFLEDMLAARDLSSLPALATKKAFRDWEDADLGIDAWTSFAVDSPGGANSDLAYRLTDALALLQQLRTPDRKSRNVSLDLVRLRAEVVALCRQVEELQASRDEFREDAIRYRQLSEMKGNISLRTAVSKLAVIGPPGAHGRD